jgi:ribosomal protein S18 acetylase RimI-like enzyme
MDFDLTTSPSTEDAKTISQGLINFNNKANPDLVSEKEVKFSIFARNKEGNIIGGLRALCFWNTLHIELVWVSTEHREKGTGSGLVQQAERFALQQGYELALLETTSWQAKPFYEKLGYELMATLAQYPKDHATHFMKKKLV